MANNVYEALSTQINANREIAKLRSVLSTFPADSPVRKTVEAVVTKNRRYTNMRQYRVVQTEFEAGFGNSPRFVFAVDSEGTAVLLGTTSNPNLYHDESIVRSCRWFLETNGNYENLSSDDEIIDLLLDNIEKSIRIIEKSFSMGARRMVFEIDGRTFEIVTWHEFFAGLLRTIVTRRNEGKLQKAIELGNFYRKAYSKDRSIGAVEFVDLPYGLKEKIKETEY